MIFKLLRQVHCVCTPSLVNQTTRFPIQWLAHRNFPLPIHLMTSLSAKLPGPLDYKYYVPPLMRGILDL